MFMQNLHLWYLCKIQFHLQTPNVMQVFNFKKHVLEYKYFLPEEESRIQIFPFETRNLEYKYSLPEWRIRNTIFRSRKLNSKHKLPFQNHYRFPFCNCVPNYVFWPDYLFRKHILEFSFRNTENGFWNYNSATSTTITSPFFQINIVSVDLAFLKNYGCRSYLMWCWKFPPKNWQVRLLFLIGQLASAFSKI